MTNGNTHSIDTSAVHTGQGWTGKVSFLQGRQDQNLRGGAGGGAKRGKGRDDPSQPSMKEFIPDPRARLAAGGWS